MPDPWNPTAPLGARSLNSRGGRAISPRYIVEIGNDAETGALTITCTNGDRAVLARGESVDVEVEVTGKFSRLAPPR